MTTYNLFSSPAVHTPGLIAWAINGCHFEDDREVILTALCNTYAEVPRAAMELLILKGHPYEVEGETVSFTVEEN